ncbi:MAG: FecR domain-containing protein [Pseudomonadota bacterium]
MTRRSDSIASPSAASADFQVLQQAAEWFALLESGGATEHDRARWRAWCDAGPAQRGAWQRVEAVRRQFAPLASDGERRAADVALASAARLRSRRQSLKLLTLVGAGSVVAWIAARQLPESALLAGWRADYRTGSGDTRAVALADGTRVWLNNRTALDTRYDTAQRRLLLHAGEVFIETAHDERPFIVETTDGALRALGTRFNVRALADEGVRLDVFEGAVAVRPAGATYETTVVAAGRSLHFGNGFPTAPLPSDPAREAWVQGVLLANDLPLADFAAELSRYRHGHLAVAPEVAALRVVGAYPLNDPDRALAMLEAALPVRVRTVLPWWVSIEARGSRP